MSLVTNLLGGGISTVVDSIGGIVKTVAGDKAAREENIHDEQMAASDQQTAETIAQGTMQNRTWWDSLVDGLNRLMRPVGFFGTIALFGWAGYDPLKFSEVMVAFGLVPEWLALIAGQIILLTYGGRMLDKWSMKGPSVGQIQAVLQTQKQIQALHQTKMLESTKNQKSPEGDAQEVLVSQGIAVDPYNTTPRISDKDFQKEMASPEPLSLPAIVEWNKRQNAGK